MKTRKLYVATGAYDSGKTSTLEFLNTYYNFNVHQEAPKLVLDALKEKKLGHQLEVPFERIYSSDHFCPLCNLLEFTNLALEKQKEIENKALKGDFVERGYIDIIEFFLRNSQVKELPNDLRLEYLGNYQYVFLFEVMPEIQVSKWGKTRNERIEEAKRINESLFNMYIKEGYDTYLIPPDSINNRAKIIYDITLR